LINRNNAEKARRALPRGTRKWAQGGLVRHNSLKGKRVDKRLDSGSLKSGLVKKELYKTVELITGDSIIKYDTSDKL